MILVTGGAGYIGSHTVRQLVDRGYPVVVLDSLYSGHRAALPPGVELIEGNVGDAALVGRVLRDRKIESVIHFAAHLEVEESARDPLKYYRNNFVNSMSFIELCHRAGVARFIFSSTCAVYGSPSQMPVTEETPTSPVSPYGRSKLMTEHLLRELETAGLSQMRSLALRYFNVAGARVEGGLGQSTPRATQLVKVASEVVTGKRRALTIFGTDYPTPDGTCVRDYIHVDDLADAHILALEYLSGGGASAVYNCGYGTGYSVFQVVEAMKRVSGTDFPIEHAPRRPGDAVAIYADATRIKKDLGWKPRYANLDLICKTALAWERQRPY